MRKTFLLILLIFCIGIVPVAVRADDPWECDYDFSDSQHGFAVVDPFGQWEDGVGYTTADEFVGLGGYTRSAQIQRNLPGTTFELNQISITFDLTKGFFEVVSPVMVLYVNGSFVDFVNPDDITDGTGKTFTWDGTSSSPTTIGAWGVSSYDSTGPITYDGSITLTSVHLEGTGEFPCEIGTYFNPVASADADAWGTVEKQNPASEPQDHAIFAYSASSGLNVYAATDATVTSVRHAPPASCDEEFGRGHSAGGGGFGVSCSFDPPGEYARAIDGSLNLYSGSDLPVWLVTLFSAEEGREFNYWVDSADLYVTEGQTVSGGCLIGKTMKIDANELPQRYLDQGLTIVTVKEAGAIVDSIYDFSIDPDPAAPCNQDEQYQECMGDVQLRDNTAWVTSGDVVFLNPGFGLGAGEEYISTTMNLDGTQEPELVVRAKRWVGSNGKLELTLGQTVTTQTLTSDFNNYGTVSIAGGAHEADGTFYTIRVKNLSGGYIDIQSVCIRFTADEEGTPIPDLPDIEDPPDQEQQACIFAQNSFNAGTGSWSVSGSVEGATGEIRVPSGQTFSQNVTVLAGEYTLSLVAAVWSYSEYSPDDQDTASDIEFSYDFDGSASMGSKTFGEYAQSNNLVVYQTALSIASDTTDDFTFTPTISDPPAGVRGVAVRAVCIDDGDYGDGTGSGGDGQGGGDDTPFEESCAPIAQPSGNSSIGSWISWLWVKLNGFYRCELIILLNNMYKLMRDSWLTTSWSIRWTQAATRQSLKWFAEDWTFWLGGHLANIAVGQVTTITTEGGGTCGNLFCLLQTLIEGIQSLGTSIVDGIRDVLTTLIGDLHDLLSTLLDMIQQLLDFFLGAAGLVIGLAVQFVSLLLQLIAIAAQLFQLLIQAVVTVINAWIQAAPQDLIPSCALDQTSARCMFFYIAERTVFTESGALIIPTLAGAIYLALILWVIRRVNSALRDLGTLS